MVSKITHTESIEILSRVRKIIDSGGNIAWGYGDEITEIGNKYFIKPV